MGQLQTLAAELEEMGYRILAISPDVPEKAAELKAKQGLSYEVLSDVGLVVTKTYGIVFQVGENRMMPVPAVYVVGKDRTILFHYVHPNYRVRLDSDLLLAAAKVGVKE